VCVLSALAQPINYKKSRDKLSYNELVLAAELIDNALILLLYQCYDICENKQMKYDISKFSSIMTP